MVSSNTGSIIEGANGRDRTGTGISTNIIIKVGPLAVGAVQSIQITETRAVGMIDEVGYDGHIDSVPTKSTDISGTIRRTRFDRIRITEALGRGYLHISSQRIPFDIDIYDAQLGDGANAIITTIKNVWITNQSYTYSSDNFVIVEDMSFVAEAISSTLNGGNAATGGERGSNIMQINDIERASDRGLYRGSLSAPGLINDFFKNI